MNKLRLFFVSFILVTAAVFACFNIEFAPTFHAENYPADMPSFFNGNLGVIQPRFYHFYLFAAYRQITGLGLDQTEKRSLAPGLFQTVQPSQAIERTGYDIWLEKVSPAAPRRFYSENFRSIEGGYQHFLNCSNEAYEMAVRTLEERTRRFGGDSEPVRSWLEAQKQVFSNCSGGSIIPVPVEGNVDPVIRADREYQIACAYFYSGSFDEAAKRFEGIAADPTSPWNRWGKYLAARAFIRKGTLFAEPAKFDEKSLEEAAVRLREVLADPQLGSLHASAQGLVDYIQLRIDPQKRFEGASRIVMAQKPGEAIGQAWIDFDYLLDRGFEPQAENDLWTWLKAVRGEGNAPQIALERWRATKAPHWLLAAIVRTETARDADELLEAAAQLPQSSPAYLTVTYHRLRLELVKGQEPEVRSELDRLLSDSKRQMARDSRNLFLALRFGLLTSFDEFLKYAPREPMNKDFIGAKEGSDKYLDEESLVIFNMGLPLALLEEAVKRPALPVPIRQELALAAWSRAVLIGDRQAANRLAVRVKEYWPELRGDLAAYQKSEDEANRRFSFVVTLLKHPGIQPYLRGSLHRQTPIDRIDDLRENWWCGFEGGSQPMHTAGYRKRTHLEVLRHNPQYAAQAPSRVNEGPNVSFLTDDQKKAASEELDRLRRIPAGPDFLCEETLRWAEAHPKDPRVAEALHLAVKATRFGCESDKTTDWSKTAFQFLHRQYPSSQWAKATPYWY